MTRRLMVVEPDAHSRAMLDRALTAAGYTAEDFASVHDARILLDEAAFDAAVVDELAGAGAALDEVRFLRARFPRLPLVVTGTMLTAPVLLELLRLGVADALPKPFTPGELREAVARALARASRGREDALDYAAAVAAARGDLAAGDPAQAARALARAYAQAPLEADVVALEALRAELEGRDPEAERGYRAALALRHEEDAEPPDPHEGLARLEAYGPAVPVVALSARFRDAPLWLVTDPARELPAGPPRGVEAPVVVLPLAFAPGARNVTVYLREGGDRAYALLPTDLRPERAAPLLARLGTGRLVAGPTSLEAGLDLARLTDARDELLRGGARPRASTAGARP